MSALNQRAVPRLKHIKQLLGLVILLSFPHDVIYNNGAYFNALGVKNGLNCSKQAVPPSPSASEVGDEIVSTVS